MEPEKKNDKKRKRLFYDILLVAGILLLIGSFVYFYFFYKDYADAMAEYDSIAREYTTVNREHTFNGDLSLSSYLPDNDTVSGNAQDSSDTDGDGNGGVVTDTMISSAGSDETDETGLSDTEENEEEAEVFHHIDYSKGDIPFERLEDSVVLQWYEMISVNLSGLRSRNPEVRGWIFFEKGDISYPILQGEDNSKYLNTTAYGSASKAGSIFMDFENAPDFSDPRTVVYGHNMRNTSMFGKLKYYKKPGYYEDNRYFQIIIPGAKYRYEIFSYFEIADTEVDMVMTDYEANEDYRLFINHLKNRSNKAIRVNTDANSRIVSLVTCSNTGRRFMVTGVRVDVKQM